MKRWWIVAAVAVALVLGSIVYWRHRESVAYREKVRFWELIQREGGMKQPPLKADEEAELMALRRRVGEREADKPGRPPH